jgi:hypothetical protein
MRQLHVSLQLSVVPEENSDSLKLHLCPKLLGGHRNALTLAPPQLV